MPIPLIVQGFQEGVSSIPYAWEVLRVTPWVLLFAALKYYFGGARNTSERLMHSKVVMVTVCKPVLNMNTRQLANCIFPGRHIRHRRIRRI